MNGGKNNMDFKLPTTINTFSNMSRALVSGLIRDMKVDKSNLNQLINKIRNFNSSSYYPNAAIPAFSNIDAEPLVDTFRDTSLRLDRIFISANAVGGIISSMAEVFNSEIKKIEKDIYDLENFINNYEYLSGKDDNYSVNYIENFDINTKDYRYDNIFLELSDRDSVPFPEDGGYFIDYDTSSIRIGKRFESVNVFNNIKNISIKNNYSFYTTTNTNFLNLFNEDIKDTWTVSIKSPVILTAQPNEVESSVNYDIPNLSGALTFVEVEFYNPIKSSGVKINPNIFNGLSLLQVTITGVDGKNNFGDYSEKNISKNQILKEEIQFNGLVEVDFPETLIYKIAFVFRQGSYTKEKLSATFSETLSRRLSEHIKKVNEKRSKEFSVFQDMVYEYFLSDNTVSGIKTNLEVVNKFYSNRFPTSREKLLLKTIDQEILSENRELTDLQIFNQYTAVFNMIKTSMDAYQREFKIFEDSFYIDSLSFRSGVIEEIQRPVFSVKNTNTKDDLKLQGSEPVVAREKRSSIFKNFLMESSTNLYEYAFSLKSIDFINYDFGEKNTLTDNEDSYGETLNSEELEEVFKPKTHEKACFVSSKIGEGQHVEGIKVSINLSSDVYNSTENGNDVFDIPRLFSYELSISGKELPSNEYDWLPILPYGIESVDSEVIFFNVSGRAFLRFPCRSGSLKIYKNGNRLNLSQFTLELDGKTVRINNLSDINSRDVFCAEYDLDFSKGSFDNIDLIASGFFAESVKKYITSDGDGQRFLSSNNLSYVNIDYEPYVNQSLLTNSTYNQSFGTIFSTDETGYSPVKILINNREYARNLTNYTSSSQIAIFDDSSQLSFVQSGKTIIFNRVVNEPFSVMYEYIPANLRYRLIMRSNVPNLKASPSIDSLFVKMKTRNYNPYYDRLKYTSVV
jgi:hypothetical protein